MSFFSELRRRNVLRMAMLYAVAAWLDTVGDRGTDRPRQAAGLDWPNYSLATRRWFPHRPDRY